ncbi:MAG TPA: hypothetical protein PLB88_09600 [Thermoanaerobaculaceae bacterium]|nr:hypothetical protein [Thermoanaerobaculaceae bacterium]
MSGKPRLFLLDAGPVIGLHELGLWHELLERAQVIVPAIVAYKEVVFWDDGGGVGRPIDLRRDEATGRLHICCADAAAVAAVLDRFDPVMRERIDAGEAEAIALLSSWEGERPEFCTADGAAVRAACLLALADRIVSLEAVLRRVGLDPPQLATKYGEKKVRQWVAEGRQMRVRGEGLAP